MNSSQLKYLLSDIFNSKVVSSKTSLSLVTLRFSFKYNSQFTKYNKSESQSLSKSIEE
jgi:hypothetical protein